MNQKIAICVPREWGEKYPHQQCENCKRHINNCATIGAANMSKVPQHPPALDKQGDCPSRLEMK